MFEWKKKQNFAAELDQVRQISLILVMYLQVVVLLLISECNSETQKLNLWASPPGNSKWRRKQKQIHNQQLLIRIKKMKHNVMAAYSGCPVLASQ